MDFETVFEISRHPFPTLLALSFGFFMGTVLFFKQQYKKYKEENSMTAGHVFILFLCSLLCILGLSMVIVEGKGGGTEKQYADQYYSGDYEVVEGNVKDYEKVKMGMINFFVEDKDFTFQYFIRNPVPENGYVRISFIGDDDINEIMKIEVAIE